MNKYGDPKGFWEERLAKNFDLTGVGYAPLGPAYNSHLYRARVNALEKAFRKSGIAIEKSAVLEIGCGTGFFTNFCEQRNVNVYTGIDITKISVESLAKRFPLYHFVQADIGDENFNLNEQFDNILIADVLYHIVDDKKFITAIKNIGRSLKPGGFLIISDLFTNSTIDTKQHCKWRSVSEYEDILAQNNMAVKHIEPIFAILQPPVFFQSQTFLQRMYGLVWQHGLLRALRWNWCDRFVSNLLSFLDDKYFLRHNRMDALTSKWLIAYKEDVD